MKRIAAFGLVVLLAFSIFTIACSDDDDDGDGNGTVATPTQPSDGGETPPSGSPTEPLGSELPQDVIDAVSEYVTAGNIPSFPAVSEIEVAADCTTAGQVCYDPDESTFDETAATVRVYSYASDDIQDVSLELQDGEWTVTGHSEAGTP